MGLNMGTDARIIYDSSTSEGGVLSSTADADADAQQTIHNTHREH